MKGVANWVLIIGSVIFGLIIFSVSLAIIATQIRSSEKQTVLEQIQDFHGKMDLTCNGGLGTLYNYNLNIPENVQAVYIENSSTQLPPNKVSVMITNKEKSYGKFLCIHFFEDNLPICQELECNAEFTYIGSPSMKSTLQIILAGLKNEDPIYKYKIVIEKIGSGLIKVNSEPEV